MIWAAISDRRKVYDHKGMPSNRLFTSSKSFIRSPPNRRDVGPSSSSAGAEQVEEAPRVGDEDQREGHILERQGDPQGADPRVGVVAVQPLASELLEQEMLIEVADDQPEGVV